MNAIAAILEPIHPLKNEQIREAIRQHDSNISFLDDLIFSDKSLRLIAYHLIEFIAKMLNIDYAEYRTYDKARNKLYLVAVYNKSSARPYEGRKSVSISQYESPASVAYNKPYGSPEYCSYLLPDTYRIAPQLISYGIKTIYALSVRTSETVFGVITLFDTEKREYEDFEPCMVHAKAKSLAISLRSRQDRARLRQTRAELAKKVLELESLLDTDPLTNVGSRYAFERAMRNLYSNTSNSACPKIFIFADMDNFKHINDSFGHDTGDTVLRRSARCIKECLRSSDRIWRTGGEEFGILLEDVKSITALVEIIKKIRLGLETLPLPKITVSFGITLVTGNPEKDMKNADRALYHAKDAGRNCAVLYHPSIPAIFSKLV